MSKGEHVCVANFKSGGKSADGKFNWKHHKLGSVYDGPEEQIAQFKKDGLLQSKSNGKSEPEEEAQEPKEEAKASRKKK